MIKDTLQNKIQNRIEKEIFYKEKLDELTDIVKKALPKLWTIHKRHDEILYWLEIDRGLYGMLASISALGNSYMESLWLAGFRLKPMLRILNANITINPELTGILIYPSDENGNDSMSGYNMVRKFADKFERIYDKKYEIIIKPRSEFRNLSY